MIAYNGHRNCTCSELHKWIVRAATDMIPIIEDEPEEVDYPPNSMPTALVMELRKHNDSIEKAKRVSMKSNHTTKDVWRYRNKLHRHEVQS